MKNMKVQKKLIVSFGMILVMILMMVVAIFVSVTSISNQTSEFHDKAFTGVQLSNKLDLMSNKCARFILYAANDPNTSRSQSKLSNAKTALNNMLSTVEELREIFDDTAKLDEMKNEINSLLGILETDAAVITGTDTAASYELFESKIAPLCDSLSAISTEIAEYEESKADSLYEATKGSGTLTLIIVGAISLIAIAVGVFFAIYITRILLKGINDVHNAAIKMAKGDFDVTVTYKSDDELGQMGIAIETLANNTKTVITDLDVTLERFAGGNLNVNSENAEYYVGVFSRILTSLESFAVKFSETMHSIDTASNHVSSGSEQVASSALALSQGATEQAASIEELSATMSTIADMINITASEADVANEKTAIAGNQLENANSKMQELVTAMEGIKDYSTKIEQIIKTIEDIAFQTNILSLNAAVEAARAGEAGKGFAVVADEVRNLASKSAEAAQNTQALIGSTVVAIDNGSNLVAEVAEDMNTVSESAGAVASINTKISTEAKKAADAIVQITIGIDQISSVVQTNSATSEQSAAASEELAGQSQMLKAMLDEFVLYGEQKADAVEEAETIEETTEEVVEA